MIRLRMPSDLLRRLPETRPIPLSVPSLTGSEWAYVRECLDTNFVSSVGPFVDRFEHEFKRRVGASHAVATVNGTAALHVALILTGLRPDDEVIVSALSFIAPANAIRYVGAWPVFCDAEPDYWQMDVRWVENFLRCSCVRTAKGLVNQATGRTVRAILPVHILGHPVDMDPLLDLAKEFDLVVVEDATEGLGAIYKGKPVGTLGDASCFSFNGNKMITTGGGGMVVTPRDDWAARAKYLTTQAKDDPLEFIHGAVGYNYRLTNIQAALGCAQLEQLDAFLVAKRRIADAYESAFTGVAGLTAMPEAGGVESAYWLYTLLVDEPVFGMDSRALIAHLRSNRIEARPLWQPLHLSPAHADAPKANCPVAERLYARAVSLPCSVDLDPDDQTRVIETILHASRRG